MSEKKKAIVVGAGILGLATARALALKGYQVDVYERNPAATGASVRNFGMVWPIGQPAGKLYERAIRSRECWTEIGDAGPLWYDPVGSLHVACSQDEWKILQELYTVFKTEGRDIFLLNKQEVLAKSAIAHAENIVGGLYSSEEIIVDPRKAIAFLPTYLREKFNIHFHWEMAVNTVHSGYILIGSKRIEADQIFICSGADFETIFPEEFAKYPLTKCKLQMMRIAEDEPRRIGPALCGGLSLIHYNSFKAAPSLPDLRKKFEAELPEYLSWGIHVMVSQNQAGHLTIGDSHEYGLSPDPFDKKMINDLIVQYLDRFATLRNPKLIETWNGVYGKFKDGSTELFTEPEKDVFILNGVGGVGMTLSFGLAEEIIQNL